MQFYSVVLYHAFCTPYFDVFYKHNDNHRGFEESNNAPKACQTTPQFVVGFGYRYEVIGHLRVKSINRADSIEKAGL